MSAPGSELRSEHVEKKHENSNSFQKRGISSQTEILEQLDAYAQRWFRVDRCKACNDLLRSMFKHEGYSIIIN